MISDVAKAALSNMLEKSIMDNLTNCDSTRSWSIETIRRIEETKRGEFVMITVSSLIFRVIISIHFTRNHLVEQFVSQKMGVPPEEMTETIFYDYFGEFGNLFCGSIKRELSKAFPHLGMSTPDRLNATSYSYIFDLKNEEFNTQLCAKSNDGLKLEFSLCACSFGDLDFMIAEAEEEEVFGELEFF